MPDDFDDIIRGAMKTLDEQTPSGYFEAVPNQILARLEDGNMMQHSSGTTDTRDKRDALMGAPVVPDEADTNPTPKVESSNAVAPLPTAATPVTAAAEPKAAARDEDSGLHDIRNLAQSTKQRLSSRRITAHPPMKDEDVLASSSGSFANIALPQPANMVSLPDLEDLPSKQEVLAAQKAAAKARKQKVTVDKPLASNDVLAPQATANAALASLTAMPVADTAAAVDAPHVRQAFSLPSMERKKSKGGLFAVIGLGVAAAAGGFIMMSSKDDKASSAAAAKESAPQQVAVAAPTPAPTAEPIAAAGSAAVVEPAPAVEEARAPEPAIDAKAVVADDDAKPAAKKAGKGAPKKAVEAEAPAPKVEKTEVKPAEIKKPDGSKAAPAGGEGEPSFDALLKEAGVEDKKDVKPKLEKKSLSGDDFKNGMSAIKGKAQGCYKGTQGTASVKLTIGPSGAVTKAAVGGQFAGTPEGACVEAAVKSASFPPWDGGPQSFNFSYMLSD